MPGLVCALGCTVGNKGPNHWDVRPRSNDEITRPAELDTQKPRVKTELLIFTADWCKFCQRDKEYWPKDALIIDVDTNPVYVQKWGVTRLPTYILLEDRREVLRTYNILDAIR